MLDRIRDIIDFIMDKVWTIVLIGIVVILFGIGLNRPGSGTEPQVLQLTLDSLSTQSNQDIPTIASQLTQTPAEAMLTGAAPTLVLLGRQEIQQFAAAARSPTNTDEDPLDGGSVQVVGSPDTEGCTDAPTAWRTTDPRSTGTLEVLFAQAVIPTGIFVHQNFNPGYITSITITDLFGEVHAVYEGTPEPAFQCPFVLVVPVEATYPASKITVFLDQSTNTGGWNQIDAVQLVGIKY